MTATYPPTHRPDCTAFVSAVENFRDGHRLDARLSEVFAAAEAYVLDGYSRCTCEDDVHRVVQLDRDVYVELGASARFDGTDAEWSDRFRALGGRVATVEPGGIYRVSGTRDAVAFALDTAPIAEVL